MRNREKEPPKIRSALMTERNELLVGNDDDSIFAVSCDNLRTAFQCMFNEFAEPHLRILQRPRIHIFFHWLLGAARREGISTSWLANGLVHCSAQHSVRPASTDDLW